MAKHLERWLNEKYQGEDDSAPTVALTLQSNNVTIIEVGPFTVWHSEADSEESLNLVDCLEVYKNEVKAQAVVLKE